MERPLHVNRAAAFCIVFLLYFVKKYVKLKIPPEKAVIRCYLQAQVVMLPALYRCSFYME